MMVGYVRRLAERECRTRPRLRVLDAGAAPRPRGSGCAPGQDCLNAWPARRDCHPASGANRVDVRERGRCRAGPGLWLVRTGGRISMVGRRAQPAHHRCPWRSGRILAGNGRQAVHQAAIAAAAAAGRQDRRDAGAQLRPGASQWRSAVWCPAIWWRGASRSKSCSITLMPPARCWSRGKPMTGAWVSRSAAWHWSASRQIH